MNAYLAFLKKEFYDYLRSYKLFVLMMVFLALGFLNPISARYLPEVAASLLPDGIQIQLPQPEVMDSWAQFYKNISQIGIIILLIVFSTMISNELQKGTLIHLLTKGLSRTTILLAKYSSALLVWTCCYGISFLVTYLYNFMFWPLTNVPHLLLGIFCIWLFGCLLLALLLLGGVLTKTSIGSLLCTGGFFLICMGMSLFPPLQEIQPAILITNSISLLQGQSLPADYLVPILLALLLIGISLSSAVVIFRHQQL